jgi:CRP/FNR family transcriptional regulator, global nitrogen regulator
VPSEPKTEASVSASSSCIWPQSEKVGTHARTQYLPHLLSAERPRLCSADRWRWIGATLLALRTKGDLIHEPLASLPGKVGPRQASLLEYLEASGVPVIERRYAPGEHPYMHGGPDEGLWFLLEGTLKVYKLYGAFREATVRLLDGNGLFGEPSLRPAGRHRDSAEALYACRAAKVPKGPLLRLLSKDSSCAPALLEAFAECAEEREAAVGRLLSREVDGRLACLLVELAERFGEEDGRGRVLGLRLSHKDLSCMVACTREAVSKAISGFREAGIIETPRPGSLVVMDESGLRKVATGRTITAPEEFTKGPWEFSGAGALRASLLSTPVVP